jgi:uncharacterized lipoprotein YmbA
MVIVIGHVQLPDYVARPQLVTRVGQNELQIHEYARWSENLTETFSRVLAADISALLPAATVVVFPWEGVGDCDYRVDLHVLQFDLLPGDSASLGVQWLVRADQRSPGAGLHQEVFRETLAEDSYEEMVAAQSRTVAALSRAIAAQIQSMEAARGSDQAP